MKLSRRATTGCSGNSPAIVASRIMSRIRDLAAITAPRCAGRATSTDLLHPIPDRRALSVACCALCLVNPENSFSSDSCPSSSKVLADVASVRMVAMHPEVVKDSADPTLLNTFAHGSDDVHFCQELMQVHPAPMLPMEHAETAADFQPTVDHCNLQQERVRSVCHR